MAFVSQMQVLPSQLLPIAATPASNQVVNARGNVYGDVSVTSRIPTKGQLAIEGAYFTANNAQSGIATAATPTAFSATNPFITIWNTGNPTNPAAPKIVLDYVSLLVTAAGTAGASIQAAVTLDNANRYTSGGTALTPQKTNSQGPQSAAVIYGGNITAAAATSNVRTIVGNRYLKGAIGVAGDLLTLQFGSVDNVAALQAATIIQSSQGVSPVVINPGEIALVHLWLPSQSAASSYAPELGWYETV